MYWTTMFARSLLAVTVIVFASGGAPTSQGESKTSIDPQVNSSAAWQWDSGMGGTMLLGGMLVFKHDAQWERAVAQFRMEMEGFLKARAFELPGRVQDTRNGHSRSDEFEIVYQRKDDEVLPGAADGIDSKIRVRIRFSFSNGLVEQMVPEVDWRTQRRRYEEPQSQVVSQFIEELLQLVEEHRESMSLLPVE